MDIFGGMTIQAVFLIVIGAALLVVGTSGLRRQIRIKRSGLVKQGKVLHSKHIEKKDKDGYLIQNYYEVRVEYEENGHRQQKTLKSIDEFREGNSVRLLKDDLRGNVLRIYENDKAPVFGPWILILAGILIIFLPFIQKKYGTEYVSAELAVILLIIGAGLVFAYVRDRNRDTTPIPATIVEVLKWQNGQKKKWSNPAVSYYPVLEYERNGQKKRMRSRYNSSTASTYKVGKEVTLYMDNRTGSMIERGPRISMLITGMILCVISFVGIYGSVLFFLGK